VLQTKFVEQGSEIWGTETKDDKKKETIRKHERFTFSIHSMLLQFAASSASRMHGWFFSTD
jgi:hypothetical protein